VLCSFRSRHGRLPQNARSSQLARLSPATADRAPTDTRPCARPLVKNWIFESTQSFAQKVYARLRRVTRVLNEGGKRKGVRGELPVRATADSGTGGSRGAANCNALGTFSSPEETLPSCVT
jgi:hypothetical protein